MKVFKEIWFEMILIAIFSIVVYFYNEKIGMLIVFCSLITIVSFLMKDNKIKLVGMFVIAIILIYIGVYYIKNNKKIQAVLQMIYNDYVWLVWFNCAVINNMLVSKVCTGKKVSEKISCVLGYIVALILSLYFSFIICIQFKLANVQDMSIEINFVTAIFVLVYAFLQVILCTKDELYLLLFWKYELDHKNDIVKLLRCRIKKRKYIIKSHYSIGNKKMKTYLSRGVFNDNKKVEDVTFLNGVEMERQTIFTMFKYCKNLNKVTGLTKCVSCDYMDRKNLPSLKSIQWINFASGDETE